jgi:hypothetical protein
LGEKKRLTIIDYEKEEWENVRRLREDRVKKGNFILEKMERFEKPVVKTPLKCKLNFHLKLKYPFEDISLKNLEASFDFVDVCRKCGVVRLIGQAIGALDIYEWHRDLGYVDPRKLP